MEPRPPDRRVQKTLKLLHEALMSLVLEQNYELISVQEILDRANVGRSTFYNHYRDKDDLLLKAFDTLYSDMKASQAKSGKTATRPAERVIAFSGDLFRHAQGYRKTYEALIRSQAGPIVRQRIQKIIETLIQDEFKKAAPKYRKQAPGLPRELLIHFTASTLLSVLTWWVEDKNDTSPEAMNDMYRSLVLPPLEAGLG